MNCIEHAFEKDYLTIKDVRGYLNLSQSAAYQLVHRKDFPVAHFGGSIRVPREPFIMWVKQNTYIPRSLEPAAS